MKTLKESGGEGNEFWLIQRIFSNLDEPEDKEEMKKQNKKLFYYRHSYQKDQCYGFIFLFCVSGSSWGRKLPEAKNAWHNYI